MINKFADFWKKYVPKGSFGSNVLTLMTGTTIAQVIPIAVSPILTRLYTPGDFGIFNLYLAIISILSVVVTGRYEFSIMLPEKEEDSINIFALCLAITLAVSIIVLIVITVFGGFIIRLLNNSELSRWLYFVPLSILIVGFYQPLNYWQIGKKGFGKLAANKIVQSGAMAGFQVGTGYFAPDPGGLILGQIAGQGIGVGILGRYVLKEDREKLKAVTFRRMMQQAGRYRKFPQYSLVADLINTFSNQMPNFLLNSFFGTSAVGFFALTQRVLGSPISLIAGSILDVFKERASRDYRTLGNCRDIYIKTFKSLLLISIVPFLIFFLAAPAIFSFIFGANWRVAGEYARILSVMFLCRFVASPLSYVLFVAEKQNYDLIWQIFLFISTVISIGIGIYLKSDKISLMLFSASYSIMYIFYLFLSYNFAKGNTKQHV